MKTIRYASPGIVFSLEKAFSQTAPARGRVIFAATAS
jgi:hypothetical protein